MYLDKILFCLVLTFLKFRNTESANILFYHAVSSYSHRVAVWPWVEALAAHGHNITFLQPFLPKHPNPKVTEFFPKGLTDVWSFQDSSGRKISDSGFLEQRLEEGQWAFHTALFQYPVVGYRSCEEILSHPEGLEFVNSNKFDLVVIDFLFNDCAFGLAHKWGAKTILYYSNDPAGSFLPEALGFQGTDNFDFSWNFGSETIVQKVALFFTNTVFTLFSCFGHALKVLYYYPKMDTLMRNKLNMPEMPSLAELVPRTNLVFYNGHFTESDVRTFPPLFVPVPAMHVWNSGKQNSSKPLPKDMAKFIDESGDDGFIYVSFGSLADINGAPREFKDIFLRAFERSKTRFVWKIEGDITKEMPSNVFTAPWMPQGDILASKKCKAFISHGGLLGTQEAVMHGVPMIVLPIFGEQDFNAARIHTGGRGIALEVSTLTEKQLTETIQEILTNKRYKQTTEKISAQLKDQQNSPIDTAVYWTEYVLRHDRKDLDRLRPRKWRHSYWFQAQLLDVWIFLFFVIFGSIYFSFRILKLMLSLLFGQKKHKTPKLKTN